MPTIPVFSGQLIAGPAKPVICLDTCDILEFVQCLDWEKSGANAQLAVTSIEPVQTVLDALIGNPHCVQLVITDLVRTEWIQNIRRIRTKAKECVRKVDEIVGRLTQAAAPVGTVMPHPAPIAASTLVADLVNLSITFLRQATRLDLDDALIQRALNRVMTKRRPSHDGHIKVSINFEHYLAFARQLRLGNFVQPVLFVSKNRKDYWDGHTGHIHSDLASEINDPAVQIGFFGNLNAALGFLHI